MQMTRPGGASRGGEEAATAMPIPGLWRAVAGSVGGNGLEWFDFLSYAYFASSIG